LGPDLPQGPDGLQGLGEALIKTLKAQEEPRTISRGVAGIQGLGAGAAAEWGAQPAAAEVTPRQLTGARVCLLCAAVCGCGVRALLLLSPCTHLRSRPCPVHPCPPPPHTHTSTHTHAPCTHARRAAATPDMLTFPATWGPTEWGPMPFLPSEDALVRRMEAQWGSLLSYRGINSTASGSLLVPGVQLGKLWIGVQPLLGLEGASPRGRVRAGAAALCAALMGGTVGCVCVCVWQRATHVQRAVRVPTPCCCDRYRCCLPAYCLRTACVPWRCVRRRPHAPAV
jgi:hypothetical protein